MSFNIGGGQSRPFIKYNAKSGRWYVRNGANEEELDKPELVLDLGNGQSGWFRYLEGQAPSRVIDPDLRRMAPQPTREHKRGIVLACLIRNGDGTLFELSSASWHACKALSELHDAYESEHRDHPGEVPIVKCGKPQPQKDQYGTNFKPTFTIVGWMVRPAELPDQPPTDNDEVWSAEKPSVVDDQIPF